MAGSAIRARIRLEGAVELEYLQKHIEAWARAHPELVKQGLTLGANELWWAVRMEMGAQLRTRTGQLQAAIDKKVYMEPGGLVDAEVFIAGGPGSLQNVKMRALELGSYRQHPGGVAYVFMGGKPRWITKDEAEARDQAGSHVLRTKGPYGIRVGRHPVFKTALRKKRTKISQFILHEIIEGFKRERAAGRI